MLRSLFAMLVTTVYTYLVGTPFVLLAALTGRTDLLYQVGRRGARLFLRTAGVRVEAYGLDKIPKEQAVVFMSNHQSNCDPPAIVSVLPRVRIMGKKEFFRVPVLGRGMRKVGFIPVDRKNREKAIRAVENATESLKAGHSFLVFPEGTRSPDGRLQPFKKGVFVMAIQAGVPVVPISASGGSRIMPKGSRLVSPGVIRISFHEPIPTEEFTLKERDQIMAKVKQAILTDLLPEEWPIDLSDGRHALSSSKTAK